MVKNPATMLPIVFLRSLLLNAHSAVVLPVNVLADSPTSRVRRLFHELGRASRRKAAELTHPCYNLPGGITKWGTQCPPP